MDLRGGAEETKTRMDVEDIVDDVGSAGAGGGVGAQPTDHFISFPVSTLVAAETAATAFFKAAGGEKPDDPVNEAEINALVAQGAAVVVAAMGSVAVPSPDDIVGGDIDALADQMLTLFQTGGVKDEDAVHLKAVGHLQARAEEGAGAGAGADADEFAPGDVDLSGRTHVAARGVNVVSVNDVVVVPPAGVGAYGLGRSIKVGDTDEDEVEDEVTNPDDPAHMYPYIVDSRITSDMPIPTQAATIEAWMVAEAKTRMWFDVGVTRSGVLVMTNGMWFRAAPINAVKAAVKATQGRDPVGANGPMHDAIAALWSISAFTVPLTHNVHGLSYDIQDEFLVVSTSEGSVYIVDVIASILGGGVTPCPLTAPNNAGIVMAMHVMPLPYGSPPKNPIWAEVGTVPVLWFWSPTDVAKVMDEITTRLLSGGFRTLEEAADAPGAMGISMADAKALAVKRGQMEAQQAKMRVAFHTEPGSGAPRPPAPGDHAPLWARSRAYCELWKNINAVGMAGGEGDDEVGDVFALLGLTSPVISIAVSGRGEVPPSLGLDPPAVTKARAGMGAGSAVAPKVAVAVQGGPPIVVFPTTRHVIPITMNAKYVNTVAEREAALTAAERKSIATWGGQLGTSDIDTPVVMSHMTWAGGMLVAASRDDAEWFIAVIDADMPPPHRTPVVADTGVVSSYVVDSDGAGAGVGAGVGAEPPPLDLGKPVVVAAMEDTPGLARSKKSRGRSLSTLDDSVADAAIAASAAPPSSGARRRVAGPGASAAVTGNGAMYSVPRTFGASFGQLAVIKPMDGLAPADPRLAQPVRSLGETRAIAARVFGGLNGNENFQVASIHGDLLSVYTCTAVGSSDVFNIVIPGIDDIAFLEAPGLEADVLLARLSQSNDVVVINVGLADGERGAPPVPDIFPDVTVPGGFQVSGRAINYKSIVSTVTGDVVAFRRSASTMVTFHAGRRL